MIKQILLFSISVCSVISLSAQTKTSTSVKTTSKTTVKTTKAAAPRDTSLCSKNWVLAGTEEFGVESKPTKKQAEDYLWMSGKGTYKLKRNGEDKAGTWTRSGAFIFFTDEATKEKFNYKVESVEENKLKVDYHVSDMHTLFLFELK